MTKTLNLRVYRRTLEYIALLWNKEALTPEQLKNTEIFVVQGKERRKIKHITSEEMESILEDGLITPDSTVLALIKHDTNQLDPYTDYTFEVIFNKDYKAKIVVYSFGVLPPMEKDDKKLNVHLYGFLVEEQKWAKLPLVRNNDGSLAIPVKIIKE